MSADDTGPPSGDVVIPGILFADGQGRCTQVNSGWTRLTGSESRVNSGDGWQQFIHPEDRPGLNARWKECVQKPREFSAPVRILAADGQVRHMLLSAWPVSDSAKGLVISVVEGEPALDEAELLQARKMEALGRLSSGLAHDFANLLTLISGYGDIVLSRLGPNDPLREEINEIRQAGSRGSGLTRQVLAFSRREAVEPQVLDLNVLVMEMRRMLRRMVGEHIEVVTELSADLGRVKAAPGQIEQVIMNLAINARDAMPGGGIFVMRTSNLELGTDHERARNGVAPGAYVMLQFADSGHGMDRETLARVFQPFFTTKGKGKGTGLGLASVREVVKRSLGDMWVESEPGKGTTFTVLLPRVESAGTAEAADTALSDSSYGAETILLVEDEEGVRRLLTYLLGKHGYKVLEAANGEDALSIFEQQGQDIDLLLTDVVMPRMNGRELANRVAKLRPELKIIFMSGYAAETAAGPGTSHPQALFLQKPMVPAVLAARIREVLDGGVKREARPADPWSPGQALRS